MNKFIALFTLIIVSLNLTAQGLTEKDIFGNWKVKEIKEATSNPDYAPIVDGFSKAEFKFGAAGAFELIKYFDLGIFDQIAGMMKGTTWKFDTEKQLVKVGSEADKFSILGIYVKKMEGSLHFHLKESGLKFLMVAAE